MALIFLFLVAPLMAMWDGYVLSILWKWFLVGPFGLPVLSVPVAIGVSLIVGYMTKQHPQTDDEDEEKKWVHLISTAFMKPLVALGMGYIVTLFL